MSGDQPSRQNPFPGLRPFGAAEADLFFGRDRQTDELLRRLARQRLLAVVGTSGSGKSSLVHAGLVPALESGFMADAGTRWRVVSLRPQSDPLGSLAQALCASGAFRAMGLGDDAARAILETTLRRSSLGLVEAARLMALPPRENLLVFVDQFEELFRYADLARERGSADDAAAFVQLLLPAVQQEAAPLYVVLTMRSDFLGDCARYRGLPEAISDGQYLIPRLSRDELRQAITGPVGVRGGHIDEALVQQLLNNVGDDPDQLPVLQHALMRAWDHWQSEAPGVRGIGLDDLEVIGGLAEALSRHADEAWERDLDEAGRALAARVFRCLTERVAGPREVRRPTSFATLQAITRADRAALERVVNVFRAPGRSFLMPPHGTPLAAHTEIDISHESLIRQWRRLREWVDDEWESRAMYLRLVQAAELHRQQEAGLWDEPALGHALRWARQEQPGPAWADRYAPGLQQALAFLEDSRVEWERQEREAAAKAEAERDARERELTQARELARLQAERAEEQRLRLVEQAQRQRTLRLVFVTVGLTLLGAMTLALFGWQNSAESRKEAEKQASVAEAAREEARQAGLRAESEARRMETLLRNEVRDPALLDRLLAQIPGVSRGLSVTQQITRDIKAKSVGAGEAGPRQPQPPGFKLWRNGSTLRVRFLGGDASVRSAARAAAEEWARSANVRFRFVDDGDAEIRIAFKQSDGAWSYVGVDALGIRAPEPTMNLGFLEPPAALQQFGHVLGLINEHQNPNALLPWNRVAVYKELTNAPNFWDRSTVDQNVFSTMRIDGYRAFDPNSVMMKFFPGHYFTDGVERGGKKELSEGDKAFARKLYPPG